MMAFLKAPKKAFEMVSLMQMAQETACQRDSLMQMA